MKIKEVIDEAKDILNKNNFEDSSIISRELLCYVLNKDKQYLIININEELEHENYLKFMENINKIVSGIPVQYITNKQEFMGLDFYVDKNVLIPQPDTEVLVENVIRICDNIAKKNEQNKKIKILDLCTGSGAIAISLSNILTNKNINQEIIASDISQKALEIATKNNKINNTKVRFIKSNLFENIKEMDFDIIVSNPPYIKTNIIQTLSKQVRNEPQIALDGGEDGLTFYRKIIKEAIKHVKNKAYICLEIGYDQKEEVLNILEQFKEYKDKQIIKDLSNNDRCIISKIIL